MEVALDEFKNLIAEFEKEYRNFRKDSPSRKTPAYKGRKLTKVNEIYIKVQSLVTEITADDPQPCIELEWKKFESNYKIYVSELKKLPDAEDNKDDPTAIHLQQQDVRFDAVRRIMEDVEAFIVAEERPTKAYCRLKLDQLKKSWERIQNADEDFAENRQLLPATYNTKMVEYEEQLNTVYLFLETQLDQGSNNNFQRNDDVKLPRVTIPKFSGDYFKWISFRDLFGTMVKDKITLSDGQKMQMLKTLVDGEAAALISDLTIADVNFDSAWLRLVERYDNNRVVVYKHLHKLITQPAAKNESKSLKKVLDTTDQTLLALKNMNRPVESWDDWIIITITQKMNEECRKDWERKIGDSTELPKWDQLKKFLGEQFRMLEGIENNNRRDNQKTQEKSGASTIKSYQSTVTKNECPACDGDHKLFSCKRFKGWSIKQRWEVARKKKLCFACLGVHEEKLNCEREKPCTKCTKKHSTWLHEDPKNGKNEAKTSEAAVVSAHGYVTSEEMNHPVGLLATILVIVQNNLGQLFYLRALVDSGSQASMITSKAAEMIRQPIVNTSVNIKGLGGSKQGQTQLVHFLLKPRFSSDFRMTVGCYILKKLTEPIPNKDIDISEWSHLNGLTLADPTFHIRGNIDLLLGADVLPDIMLPDIIKGPRGTPMAQDTECGWVVSGRYNMSDHTSISCNNSTIDDDDFDLSKFWEMETLNPPRKPTLTEEQCDEFFDKSITQNENGQFIVKIPFKPDKFGPTTLGNSRSQCLARFLYLERRFSKDTDLREEYCKVMQEYIDMGHMTEVGPTDEKLYYIPHHAVIKPESLTTKTRVVFDASANTTTGISLNDCMYTGAKQQDDLIDILIHWRIFPIVFKADIAKMYRMILIDKPDQRYHTILWRKSPNDELKEYQLNTVTFGTASAPYLATRTLVHLAKQCENDLPLAAETLRKGFYVDDLIYGCDTEEEAIAYKNELIAAMEPAKLMLRKWTSNSEQFLETIPEEKSEKILQAFDKDLVTKALGLQWDPIKDTFSFNVKFQWDTLPLTKRKLLSQASKLFDPLGWCAPVILKTKLIMQEVWMSGIDWDTLVEETTKNQWMQLRQEFATLSEIQIKRWIGVQAADDIQLHGFSDASEKAYSAVVYTRTVKNGNIDIHLIAAKTRVAPIKTKITLPRMELCGATLLAQLMTTVRNAFPKNNVDMTAWSDSTVALGWIKADPLKYKTFVANRTAEIQSAKMSTWRYCPSEDNPADCASRGLMPTELLQHNLWWNGPAWLKKTEEHWPTLEFQEPEVEQRKMEIVVNVATAPRENLLLGSSSWFRTVRVTAYCLRVKYKQPKGIPLSKTELDRARNILIKQCQEDEFNREIDDLMNKRELSSNSKILSLDPFLDTDGILRVGGRLHNAIMSFDNKHPIILPRVHAVTQQITDQMHKDTLHGGPQLMLNLLRKKYWILHGKRTVTDMYKKCLACKRFKAATVQQKMGNLPEARVTLERAFLHSGLDYCGPIEVRSSKLRGARIQKGYIAVFVCLGTRASHLELVSDCTTAAFLAAFERFTARRGLCDTVYSDNGTNFVGAYNKLAKQEKTWLHSQTMEIANSVKNKGIKWKFIPPGAPNFGGIWERNVRAVKDHLKRTLKTVRLTFEEYATVLCNIEACLNSRPMQPLTADVENINALTPGHFLIGDALMASPPPSVLNTNASRQDRWKHLQLLQEHFWKRWHREYLNHLQQRQKWKKGTETVNIGDLVLVKDEQLPPKHWLLGRIQETYPGTDGRTRVVTLKTHKGQMKRPMNKICPLMTNSELEESNDDYSASEQREDEIEENHEVEEHDLGPDVKDCDVGKPITTEKLVKPVTRTTPRYNLRPKRLMATAATIFFILAIIGGGLGKSLITVSKFKNEAGMYFEQVGRAQTVKTQWDIYIRFDLLRYRQDIKRLKQIEQGLTELCTDMESQSSKGTCEDTTGLLQHQLRAIDNLNTMLEYNGDEDHLNLRQKRAAPLNGIGWLQHELFGVMSSDQAEEIDQHFQKLKKNSLYTLQLLRNQTSIVDSTINLMKLTQEENNKNYEKIELQIDVLRNETSLMKKKMKIISMAMITLAFVNQVEQTQAGILDMLTDLHQGQVSSHVFSPKQFKEQVEVMKSELPIDSMVPEIAQKDIKSVYRIIRGSARVTTNYIILKIIFPLVSKMDFQLWHVIPIPTRHNNSHFTIVPDAEYMMMNLQRESFYVLNHQELRTCLRPNDQTFICNMKHPLYTATSTVGACERGLLNNLFNLHPSCKIQVTPEKEFWISLNTRNQWIYGVQQTTPINVVCGTASQQITLEGSGLLELIPGCEIHRLGMTIIAEAVKKSTGDFNYYPMLNLSEAVMRTQSTPDGIQLNLLNLTIDHSVQFDHLSTRLHELREQTDVHYGFHLIQLGGHTGFILIIIFGTAVVIWKNKDRISKASIKWRSRNTDRGDVEQGNMATKNDNSKIHHSSDASNTNSNDNPTSAPDSTIKGHEGGRCPFRT